MSFFQEINIDRTGILHSIDLKPPLCTIDMNGCGCGNDCKVDLLIIEWFEDWTNTTWDRDDFNVLGKKTINWPCYDYPLPKWWMINFSNLNIFLQENEKVILMIEGNVFSDDCGFDGIKCLGFSVGPRASYPANGCRVGFWNKIPKPDEWEVFPEDSHVFNFRVWQKYERPPNVRTVSFEEISYNSVKLNGNIVDDGDNNCQVRFRVKKEGEDNWLYISDWQGSYSSGSFFSENVNFLDEDGSYIFQAGAKNNIGTIWGEDIEILRTPKIPVKPGGSSKVKVGEEEKYLSTTLDPDDDELYYLFDFGDGANSEWIGPYDTWDLVEIGHIFEKRGEYEIKVKAKDSTGLETDWSEPFSVSVPRYRFFFSKLINIFLLYT